MATKRKAPPPEHDLTTAVRKIIVSTIGDGFTEVPPHGWQLTRSPEQIADIVVDQLRESLNEAQAQVAASSVRTALAEALLETTKEDLQDVKEDLDESHKATIRAELKNVENVLAMANATEDMLLHLRVDANRAAADTSFRPSKHQNHARDLRDKIDTAIELIRELRGIHR